MRSSHAFLALWLLATGAMNLLLLLFGIHWVANQEATLPGVQIQLPETTFTLAGSENRQTIMITADAPPRIFHQGDLVDRSELTQRLADAQMPLQILMVADRAAPVELVGEIAEMALLQGHQVALQGENASR